MVIGSAWRWTSLQVPINDRTGKYAHARGTATSVSVGNTNNTDFTVKLSG